MRSAWKRHTSSTVKRPMCDSMSASLVHPRSLKGRGSGQKVLMGCGWGHKEGCGVGGDLRRGSLMYLLNQLRELHRDLANASRETSSSSPCSGQEHWVSCLQDELGKRWGTVLANQELARGQGQD